MRFKQEPQQDRLVNSLLETKDNELRRKIVIEQMIVLYALYLGRVTLESGLTFDTLAKHLKDFLDNLEAHSFVIYNNAALELKAQGADLSNPFFVSDSLENEIGKYLKTVIQPLVDEFHSNLKRRTNKGNNAIADWSMINHRIFEMKRFVRAFILEMIKKNYGIQITSPVDVLKFNNSKIRDIVEAYKASDPSKYSAILEHRVEYSSLRNGKGDLTLPNVKERNLNEADTKKSLRRQRPPSEAYQQEIVRWLDRYSDQDIFGIEG